MQVEDSATWLICGKPPRGVRSTVASLPATKARQPLRITTRREAVVVRQAEKVLPSPKMPSQRLLGCILRIG